MFNNEQLGKYVCLYVIESFSSFVYDDNLMKSSSASGLFFLPLR